MAVFDSIDLNQDCAGVPVAPVRGTGMQRSAGNVRRGGGNLRRELIRLCDAARHLSSTALRPRQSGPSFSRVEDEIGNALGTKGTSGSE